MAGRPRTVTDDAILDAAQRAIDRHGPASFTLAHITAEIGLAPATLVQRFGSKRGLILALKARLPRLTAEAFAAEEPDSAPGAPTERLQDALRRLTGPVETAADLANRLAFLQLDLTDPEVRAVTTAHQTELRAQIRQLLVAATAEGELVRHDHTRLAQAIATAWFGSMTTWSLAGEGVFPVWLARDIEIVLAPYRSLVG
jgi:AcrR family transcriptional regulator